MNQKKYSFAIITNLILTEFLIQLYIPLVEARSYSLGIEVGDVCTWETTAYDKDAIDHLISYGVLSTAYESIDEGFKLKLKIDLIDETNNGWEISADGYIGENAELYDGSITWVIYKNPSDFADEAFNDDGVAMFVVFLPIDIEDYLEEFNQKIPISWQDLIEVKKNQLIQKISSFTFNCSTITEYNEQGISKEYTIIYDGDVAYKRELISIENFLFTGAVILIGIVGGITAAIVIYLRNKKKRLKRMPPPQMDPYPPYHTEIPSQIRLPQMQRDNSQSSSPIIKFCPNCGKPRPSNAEFCVDCGERYD
ncbi:MAG: zinc ribbon domain-containing protein [Promethearchaeota archaeon]